MKPVSPTLIVATIRFSVRQLIEVMVRSVCSSGHLDKPRPGPIFDSRDGYECHPYLFGRIK